MIFVENIEIHLNSIAYCFWPKYDIFLIGLYIVFAQIMITVYT